MIQNIRKLLKYLKPYKTQVILTSSFVLLGSLINVILPKLTQQIVDIGIMQLDVGYVLRIGGIMIAISFGGFIAEGLAAIFSSYASQGFSTDLRKNLFEKIQTFSYKNLDQLDSGKLITHLTNDMTQVQNFLAMALKLLLRAPILIIGSLTIAIITSPKLSIVLIFMVPAVVIIIAIIVKKAFPYFKKNQESIDKVNDTLRENLEGIRVIKAFVRKDYEKERFKKANDRLMDIAIKANRITVTILPLMLLVVNICVVAVLWIGGSNVPNGSVQIGEIVAFTNYLLLILSSLLMSGILLMMSSRAEASAERIYEVLITQPELKDTSKADNTSKINGAIEFKNVTFNYSENSLEPAIKRMNFKIKAGETIGIVGGTGSGKSTLVQLIPRLYEVTEGSISIDGKNIKAYSQKNLQKQIGMVPQKATLFSGSIKDNILMGNDDANDEELIESAKAAQAYEFIEQMSNGMENSIEEGGVNLSGGQKQRISIARAIVRKPAILILDDSTSALDAKSEVLVQEGLTHYLEDTTTIIVSQKISSIIDADKIIVLDDGKMDGFGTHEDLLNTSDVYKEIYASQYGKEVM